MPQRRSLTVIHLRNEHYLAGTRCTRCSLVSWLLPPRAKHLRGEPQNCRATPAEARGGTLCHRGESTRKTIRSALRQSKCLSPPPPTHLLGAHVFFLAPRLKQSVCGYVAATTPPPPRYRYLPPQSLHKDQLEDECTEE